MFKDLSVTFQTNRIKECVDFYGTYLQAEVTFDVGWYVSICLNSETESGLYLSFQRSEGGMDRRIFAGGVTLNLRVDEVDACWKQFRETGVPFVEEITGHEWGDCAFSLSDPIGSLLYIYSERPL